MCGKRGVAQSRIRKLTECGLKCGKKLAFKHTVDTASLVIVAYVTAYVGVEEHRVRYLVGELTVATEGDVYIKTEISVDKAEGNGGGGAVFIADYLLGVYVVNALILCGVTAKRKALADGLEGIKHSGTELACKYGRLGGAVPNEFAGLCAKLNNLALLHDHHTLAVVNGNNCTV